MSKARVGNWTKCTVTRCAIHGFVARVERGENLLAVDNDRSVLGLGMLVHNLYSGFNKTLCSVGYTDLSHPPPELQQSVAEWVGVAGPFSVVELDHL